MASLHFCGPIGVFMAAVATLQPQDDVPGMVDLAPITHESTPGPEGTVETSSPPPAPVKPPQGAELWESVKAIVTKPWVPSQDAEVPASLVVFDWDDTLLPTSALVAAKRIAPAAGNTSDPSSGAAASGLLSDWEFDDFLETCAKAAVEALQKASKYGRVVIITNSGFGWVHETAVRFMPSVLGELENIPVISARAIFEPMGIPEPYRWKVLCFRHLVDCFSFDPTGTTGPSSLISIGDGWQERVAAIMAAQDTELAMVKCMKFLEQPGADQLAQELDLCTQVFEGLAAHPSWVEASYSYTEAWGLQLEARAADTSALGGSLATVDGTVEVVADTAEEATGPEAGPVEPPTTAETDKLAGSAEKTDAEPGKMVEKMAVVGRKRLRRQRCSKVSLLARAGKMQALPLQQSYLTMSVRKVTTRRRWFQARKKYVRTLKATSLVKCNSAAL